MGCSSGKKFYSLTGQEEMGRGRGLEVTHPTLTILSSSPDSLRGEPLSRLPTPVKSSFHSILRQNERFQWTVSQDKAESPALILEIRKHKESGLVMFTAPTKERRIWSQIDLWLKPSSSSPL